MKLSNVHLVLIVALVVLVLLLVFYPTCLKSLREAFGGSGDGYYLISWKPPASDGGIPEITYNVTIKDSTGKTVDSKTGITTTQYRFSDGKWNQKYDLSVTASNSAGTGPAATGTLSSGPGPKGVQVTGIEEATGGGLKVGGPVSVWVYFTTVAGITANDIVTGTEVVYTSGQTKKNLTPYGTTFNGSSGNYSIIFAEPATTNFRAGDTVDATIAVKTPYGIEKSAKFRATVAGSSPSAPTELIFRYVSSPGSGGSGGSPMPGKKHTYVAHPNMIPASGTQFQVSFNTVAEAEAACDANRVDGKTCNAVLDRGKGMAVILYDMPDTTHLMKQDGFTTYIKQPL